MLNDIYQSIDPVLFAFGPFTVRWYGVAYVLGFVFAGLVIWRVARRWRVRVDAGISLLTIMFCVIIGVIVGGRLGYVLFYGEGYYFQHPEQILAFNKGGMSFHGGLIGALLAGIAAAKLTRIPYLTLADLGCIGARWACCSAAARTSSTASCGARPPTPPGAWCSEAPRARCRAIRLQLYEAFLEGVVIFAVLYLLSRRMPPRPRGTFLGTFLVMYGCFRFLVEFVREPDAQLGYLWGGWLTMGQLLSVPLILVGAGVLVYALVVKNPQKGLPEMQQSE